MKNIKALATAVLLGGAALLTGCGEIDPNAITLQWEGDDIGYFQCDRNEYQPATGSELAQILDSNKWYNRAQTLGGVLELEEVKGNVWGTLGGAIFTGSLFERGAEICAENGLGPNKINNLVEATPEAIEEGLGSITDAIKNAPPVAPVFETQPAPAVVEISPVNTERTVSYTRKGETENFTFTSEVTGADRFRVTFSDGYVATYIFGTAEVTIISHLPSGDDYSQANFQQRGNETRIVSENGAVTWFTNLR